MSDSTAEAGPSLLDRLELEAKAWRPNEGDTLVGVTLSLETSASDYGDPYQIVVLEVEGDTSSEAVVNDKGELTRESVPIAAGAARAFHGFHTVARSELVKAEPAVGERMGIRYLGIRETREGVEYRSYRVVVDRPPRDPDWASQRELAEANAVRDRIAAEAEDEEALDAGAENSTRQDDVQIPF